MGKPYQRELDLIPATMEWALRQDISTLRHTWLRELGPHNLITVGSGGSLVAAEFAALLHETTSGRLARSATPLEAIARQTPRDTAALLLSASGSNADILQAAKLVPELGFETAATLCTRAGSPLGNVITAQGGMAHDFPLPSGRDGFLATNSLIATLVLLYRAATDSPSTQSVDESLWSPNSITFEGTEKALDNRTIIVLGQGWATPAAKDLETRFSEGGLANVTFTDPRNFAHGRHNWLAIHSEDTAVVSLETPASQAEATRILKFLPEGIDRLRVKSTHNGPAATIDLVVAVMKLTGTAAQLRGIDPGRPSVPKFGRRMFRAGATRYMGFREATSVAKKRKALSLSQHEKHDVINAALKEFVHKLKTARFTGLVIDYDGTLCARNRRFEPLAREICSELNRLLAEGVPLGVASGRGSSLHGRLREALDPQYWDRVVVGFYNGAKVANLSDDVVDEEQPMPDALAEACSRLNSLEPTLGLETVVRPQQISVQPVGWVDPVNLRTIIMERLAGLNGVSVLSSSHSVDIVSDRTSKTVVVDSLRLEHPGCTLRIGDQGAAGGNDFELLNTGLSLSVDRVSSNLETCWNLGQPGVSGPPLTLQYLQALRGRNGHLCVDTSRPLFKAPR